jgi:hypothetical protein
MPPDTFAPPLLSVLDAFAARVKAGQPVRWHRLVHVQGGTQLHASPDLAMVTEMHWRLARAGIPTIITSAWLTL